MPTLTVDTDKLDDEDEYPIRITAVLDNLYNWFSSDNQWSSDYTDDPDHYERLYDPD